MSLYRTEGVVLRTRELGEADRIVTIFTRSHGKVTAVAKGARRTRSRFSAGVQIFTHAQFLLFRGRNMDNMSQVETVRTFSGLRFDLGRMAAGSYVSELLDVSVEEREPNEALFELLLRVLEVLEESTDPLLIVKAYESKFLALMGYMPELDACVRCRRPATGQSIAFAAGLGGILCPECSAGEEVIRVQPGSIATLRKLIELDFGRLGILRVSPRSRSDIEDMLRTHLEFHISRPVRSRRLLSQLIE